MLYKSFRLNTVDFGRNYIVEMLDWAEFDLLDTLVIIFFFT